MNADLSFFVILLVVILVWIIPDLNYFFYVSDQKIMFDSLACLPLNLVIIYLMILTSILKLSEANFFSIYSK